MVDNVKAPADFIPAHAVVYGDEDQPGQFVTPQNPLPTATYDAQGNPIAPDGGIVSTLNSTATPLGSGETFTGDWETDTNPQVGYSFQADQNGTLFLDFSRDGGATFQTVREYEVIGGEVGRFDALVKGAGRSFRLRYINNGTAQTYFQILAFTGNGLFPYAVSERKMPVGLTSFASVATGEDIYEVLVDLSDVTNYPHNDTGRIDLYGSYIFVDKQNNTVGVVQFGVIVRIDATSADIAYIQGVSFNTASERQISRDRNFTSPFRLGQENGKLTNFVTKAVTTNVTAVNTATPLGSTANIPVTPAVGDIVIRYANTSGGAFSGFVTIQYAGSVSST